MAGMSGSGLATQIKNAIAALAAEDRDFDTVWNTVGTAVVDYIKAHAVVTLNGDCIATGVTAGVASVPVTGTGGII